MRIKLLKSFAIVAGLAVFAWFLFPISFSRATVNTELTGWAWSENIGWISFTSKNCDTDGNGQSNGAAGCPSSGTAMAAYGVNRDSSGNLTGYAWSENIGWILFNPSGPYPGTPNYTAKINSGSAASGWFRAIANDVSWDGWMKFDSGGNYGSGVTLGGSQGCTMQGYAWGSDIVGWIHMNGSNYQVDIPCGQVVDLTSNVTGSGAVCSATPQPTISWTYSDPNNLTQAAYEVEVSVNSNYSSPAVDTGKVNSTSNSYVIGSGSLAYNTPYYYRVRAWNTNDIVTDWGTGTFTTPQHRGPTVSFTVVPTKPVQNSNATTTDTSTTSGGSTVASRTWTFPGTVTLVTPPATDATEVVKFVDDSNSVTLSVTDSDALTCSLTQNITTISPILDFKEVAPN